MTCSLWSQLQVLSRIEQLYENREYEEIFQTLKEWEETASIDTLTLEYAKICKVEALAFSYSNQFDQSIPKSERTITLLQLHPKTEDLIVKMLDNMVVDYRFAGDFENAKIAGKRLVNYSATHFDPVSVDHAAYTIRSSYPYFTFDDPESGDSMVSIALGIFKRIGEEMHPDINMGYNCKGIYNKNRGHYAEAALWFDKAKSVLEYNKLGESEHYVTMLHNMANVQRLSGDLDKAIAALEKALEINEIIFGKGTMENESVFTGLSNCYILKEDYDKGLHYGKRSLEASEVLYGRESVSYIKNESAYRENLLIAGRNEEAIAGHEDLGRRTLLRFGDQSESYAYYLRQVGKGLKNTGKYDDAIDQLLFSLTSFGIDPYDIQATFKIKKPATYMSVMSEIADSYYRKWFETKHQEDLLKADEYIQLGVATIQEFRKQSTLTNSKLLFTTSHSEYLEQAIELQYELYNQTQKDAYLDQGLAYIELSKNIIFTENLKSRDILSSTTIPRAELVKAQELRQRITELEESISELSDDSLEIVAQNDLHRFYNEEAKWFAKIATKYPDFSDRHYGNWQKTVTEIRDRHLRPNELVLDYFQSDTTIYVVGVSLHQKSFRKVELSKAQLHSFSDSIANFDALSLKMLSDALIVPELSHHKEIVSISILPSGSITQIPFDALIGLSGESLVESYSIRQLINFENGINTYDNQSKLLAFAPAYSNEWMDSEEEGIQNTLVRSGEWELPGALLESQNIASLMDGKLMKGQEATKSMFIEMAPDFDIIHLSMHSVLSDDIMSPSLVFGSSESKKKAEHLTLQEVYNLKLNANMVTLSACNTGVGIYQKGEGILSLAHAFGISGVPTTIMSLWKVPDESTSKIMIAFYEFLKEGLTKDEALRQAKLRYLSTTISPKQKDPFYWAGFVVVGDVSPIVFETFPQKGAVILLGGLVLGIFGISYISRKRSLAATA